MKADFRTLVLVFLALVTAITASCRQISSNDELAAEMGQVGLTPSATRQLLQSKDLMPWTSNPVYLQFSISDSIDSSLKECIASQLRKEVEVFNSYNSLKLKFGTSTPSIIVSFYEFLPLEQLLKTNDDEVNQTLSIDGAYGDPGGRVEIKTYDVQSNKPRRLIIYFWGSTQNNEIAVGPCSDYSLLQRLLVYSGYPFYSRTATGIRAELDAPLNRFLFKALYAPDFRRSILGIVPQ